MGRSDPYSPRPLIAVRVTQIEAAGVDTRLFELSCAGGDLLPAATPGAHIDVHLSEELVRSYSVLTPLSNSTHYVIAVKRARAGRGGSRHLHDRITVGSALLISPPRNNFPLNEGARETLLIAGGIGITPIYGMFERLQEAGRNVHLHYWCRSPEHILFRDRLGSHPDATIHYSTAERATIASVLMHVDSQCEVYCCGPHGMLEEFGRAVESRAIQRWHVERFSASDNEASCPDFSVVLAKSGIEVLVRSGETILNALRDAAVDVSYSCEEGVCGACEVRYLSGVPVHRDHVRTAGEHERLGTVMICCAGSKTRRLTLDL